MVVVTYRPEFTPPWLDFGHVTMVKLGHLGRGQVLELIQKAAGGKALPDPVVQQIAAKSQGVPLFVEEITRSILELGDLEERGECYVVRHPIAIRHSLDIAGLSGRAARSAGISERGSAHRVDHWEGVFL